MWSDVLHSSAQHDWSTPPELFAQLDAEYGFGLDAAATSSTALVRPFFGPDADDPAARDGLRADWQATGAEVAFLNPPYGYAVGPWLAKARAESERGLVVVCLLMARTDTRWWHESVMRADELRFVVGRIKFIDPQTGKPRYTAPAPSVVVVFRPGSNGPPRVSSYLRPPSLPAKHPRR